MPSSCLPPVKSRLKAWLQLAAGIGFLFLLIYVIAPWGLDVTPLGQYRAIEEKYGVDNAQLYYSNVPVMPAAEKAMREAVFNAKNKHD